MSTVGQNQSVATVSFQVAYQRMSRSRDRKILAWVLVVAASTLQFGPAYAEPSAVEKAKLEIKRLEEEQRKILVQIRHEISLLPPEPAASQTLTPSEQVSHSKRRELVLLLNEIERRIAVGSSDRSRYVSAATSEPAYRDYFERFRQRVEAEGMNQLHRSGSKMQHGEVDLSVSILKTGRIERIEILRSDSELLTAQATDLLKQLEPFEAFAADIAKRADRIVITVPFRYKAGQESLPSGPVEPASSAQLQR